ncbi:MAG: aspartate aminotransferase family protein [Bryobacterales bacterium]|nr:aspartate aminotransferase family protein [Bryobacterales bacterium]
MEITDRERALLGRTFLDFQATEDFLECPVILERAQGVCYWDRDGKRYLDAIGGIFVASLGHGHPRVMAAMRAQMERMTFAPPLHSISDVTLDFVERLGQVAPAGLGYVKPFSGGSEAVESSLKFARQYFKQTGRPHKYKVISRYLAYHGATFGGMAASGNGPRKTKFEPQMSGFLKVFTPNHYRDRFATWDEANRFAAQTVEDVILHEDPETVAAVIVEPVGNTGGIITPTVEYFRMLREICTRYDVLLIFDEVITGFGKTGAMFAAQTLGVTPDIICAGKGIASGAMPLGAMIARTDMAEAFAGGGGRNFAHGHTFAGHPLACAAGLAVVNEIVEQGLCARAVEIGELLRGRLRALARFGIVREIRGRGLLLGVEFCAPYQELGKAMKRAALENGLILRVDPGWFAVAPPLITTDEQLHEMCDLIEKSVQDALTRTA